MIQVGCVLREAQDRQSGMKLWVDTAQEGVCQSLSVSLLHFNYGKLNDLSTEVCVTFTYGGV